MTIPGCGTCTETGRKGSCAPLRCYCDHADCHAFESWTPLVPLNITPITRKPKSNSWANREESTWIDQL